MELDTETSGYVETIRGADGKMREYIRKVDMDAFVNSMCDAIKYGNNPRPDSRTFQDDLDNGIRYEKVKEDKTTVSKSQANECKNQDGLSCCGL